MSEHKKGTVLIVDDNPQNLQVLGSVLNSYGYTPVVAKSGIVALDYLQEHRPDIILLDIMMPEMDGYEVCKRIKGSNTISDIPILFLSAKSESRDIVQGFDCGASDYVTKPFQSAELLARVNTHVKFKSLQKQLEEQNKMLTKISRVDDLTGLSNRRYFFEMFNQEFERYKRYGRPFTLVIFDVDHFKSINDKYGHDIGDVALRELGQISMKYIRQTDVLARIGGEEFAIILTETDVENAKDVVNRLSLEVAALSISTDQGEFSFTISVGIAMAGQNCDDIDALFKNADKALYRAKNIGRNKVVAHT